MSISRRTVLQVGMGGSLLLFVAGSGLAIRRGAVLSIPEGLQVLDPHSYTTLVAVADRMCAARGDLPTASEVQVAEQVDLLMARMDPHDARDLLRVLRWLESPMSGRLFRRRGLPFSACDPATQDRILESWRTSRWRVQRTVFDALHALCQAPYWAHRSLWAHVGYDGPPDFSAGLESGP